MFNKILNLNNQNKILCFYSDVTINENKYDVKRYNSTEVNNIKTALNKYKNIKKLIFEQTESFYRNLIQVYFKYSNTSTNGGCHEENHFVKRNNESLVLENNLLIITTIEPLDEEQYPKLSKYDYTCIKHIDVYKVGNIDVLFTTFNNQISIHLDLSRMKKSDEKLFNELQHIIKK
jgi:hypothetical protein